MCRAVILFGLPEHKDALGSSGWDAARVRWRARVRAIKDALPDLVVITDVCICEYTDHGHCGKLVRDARGQRRRSTTTPRSSCSRAKRCATRGPAPTSSRRAT